MKHIWTVVCQQEIIDSRSNLLSLLNVVEGFEFDAGEDAPVIPVPMRVISTWWRSQIDQPEIGKARIAILSPMDEELTVMEIDIDLTENVRLRGLGSVETIPYGGNGIYKFNIDIFNEVDRSWNTVATIPLEINRVTHIK